MKIVPSVLICVVLSLATPPAAGQAPLQCGTDSTSEGSAGKAMPGQPKRTLRFRHDHETAISYEERAKKLRLSARAVDAADAFRQAARLWAAADDPADEAVARHLAALTLTGAGAFADARSEYEQACAGFDRIKAAENAAECRTNLATLFGRMGEYKLAEARLSEAIAAADVAHATGVKRNGLNSLANVYLFQGKHRQARETYLMLLAELRASGKPTSLEGSVLENLASSYFRTNQIDDAVGYNDRSYEIGRKLGDLCLQAVTLNMRAILLDAKNDLDGATAVARQSLELRKRLGDASGVATTLSNIASFYGDKKYGERTNFDMAAKEFIEAAEAHRKAGNLEGRASALNNAGATLTNLRQYDSAEQYLEEARQIYKRVGNRPQLANVLGNLGFNLTEQHRYGEAIPIYEEAVELLDSLRTSILDDAERVSFFAGPSAFYDVLVDLYMIEGRSEDAFMTAERARSRALLDLISAATPAIEAKIPAELRDRSRSQRAAVANAEARVRALAGSEPAEASERFHEAELARDVARSDLSKTEQDIRSWVPDLDTLTATRIPDVATIQRELLKPDEALVAYSPHRRRLQMFVVTKTTFSSRTEMFGSEKLREEINAFRNDIESRGAAAGSGKRLYDLLLQPFEQEIKGKRLLYVVGDGPLRLVPFEAFATSSDEGNPGYVLTSQSYEIVNTHSAAVLRELNKARRDVAQRRAERENRLPRRPLLLFGAPVYRLPTLDQLFAGPTCSSLGLAELKGTTEESASLVSLFGLQPDDPAVNTGLDARTERLLALPTREFRYVHFAMHGVLCPGEGRNGWTEPALAFSSDGKQPATLLRLADVFSLRFDADLITLSACETALGQEINGEGILGLTRAFLFSGSNSVISTLWRVNDDATARLIKAFYEALSATIPDTAEAHRATASALRTAKLKLAGEASAAGDQSDQRHPFYWAAYVIYGLPGRPE